MDDGLIDIGEVARRTGLAPSALRYYEEKGLIAPTARRGMRRRYPPQVLDRLAVIDVAQRAGFSLAEIGDLLVAGPHDAELRARLAAHVERLEEQIAQLSAACESLRHALRCQHRPLSSCPAFVALIRSRTDFGDARTGLEVRKKQG